VEIIHEMVQNVGMVNTRVQRGRPVSSVTWLSCLEARNFSHWPVNGNKKRCVICSQKKMRSTSSFFCWECGVALCVFPCFEDYHMKINKSGKIRCDNHYELIYYFTISDGYMCVLRPVSFGSVFISINYNVGLVSDTQTFLSACSL
jgi:hypothetical protein